MAHKFEAAPHMIVGHDHTWERREKCGCTTVYDRSSAHHFICRGHGGGWWTEQLETPLPQPPCGCGEAH